MEFQLEGEEYIELQNLLKISGLCPTGGNAKIAITGGDVLVDGVSETRRSKKIRSGQIVSFDGHEIRVIA
jgi:ribosome-associated protein